MPDPFFSQLIIGAIAGGVATLVMFYIGKRKNMKIGEGSKMGLNLSSDLKCPNCHAPLPTVRAPKNFRQMMWGGWTCPQCKAEFDKWLNPIPPK